MKYRVYTQQKKHLAECLELLKRDRGFCNELLQTETCEAFSGKLYRYLEGGKLDVCMDDLHLWLELSLQFDRRLSEYKPRFNLKFENIHYPEKLYIVSLWLIETTVSKVLRSPFGGWLKWFKGLFDPRQERVIYQAPTLSFSETDSEHSQNLKLLYDRLSENRWRQHIDWEDQELGPEVYDTGSHGGVTEPGYINSALQCHQTTIAMLGRKVGITEYEYLYHVSRNRKRNIRYDTTPRNLWRLRVLLDAGVYDDIDSAHIRYIGHYYYEVAAFNYFYRNHPESFIKENPSVVEYFTYRYGSNLKITRKMLNHEFMRCQICFFNQRHSEKDVRQAANEKLSRFYNRMQKLGFNLQSGQTNAVSSEAALQEITSLIRWLIILHPFIGGNTRHHLNLMNKLLVESGFTPAILDNRNDAAYRSINGWKEQVTRGMLRWEIICGLIECGLYNHLLNIRPPNYVYRRR